MTIYKDPNCGCCNLWAKAMENAGFTVKRVNTDDLSGIKKRFGVPKVVEGCHTIAIRMPATISTPSPTGRTRRLLSTTRSGQKTEIRGSMSLEIA
jgi:hypothetical protein